MFSFIEVGGMKGRVVMRKDYISLEKVVIREYLRWGIICSKSVILFEDRICLYN